MWQYLYNKEYTAFLLETVYSAALPSSESHVAKKYAEITVYSGVGGISLIPIPTRVSAISNFVTYIAVTSPAPLSFSTHGNLPLNLSQLFH